MALSEAQTFPGVEEITQYILQGVTKAKLLELAKILQVSMPDRVRKGELIVERASHLNLPETQSDSVEVARIQLQIKQLEHEKALKLMAFEIKSKGREEKERESEEREREKERNRGKRKRKGGK